VEDFEIVLAALSVAVAGLNVIALWLSVPYPIPLVLGGLVLGLVPGVPEIELDPDLVLLVFLPPLLYQRLMRELYTVQRRAVVELRNGGAISNDVMHRIERELDLEESRVEI